MTGCDLRGPSPGERRLFLLEVDVSSPASTTQSPEVTLASCEGSSTLTLPCWAARSCHHERSEPRARESGRRSPVDGPHRLPGFGGPPAHIALLRRLCVERRAWLIVQRVRGRHRRRELAARPGLHPACHLLRLAAARHSTALLLGGACFIAPGLIVILVLAALFFAAHTPLLIRGAAAGAGAAVAAVALQAAVAVGAASRRRGGAARRGFVGCRCGPGRATDSSLTRAASADRDTTWKGRIPAGKRRRGQSPRQSAAA